MGQHDDGARSHVSVADPHSTRHQSSSPSPSILTCQLHHYRTTTPLQRIAALEAAFEAAHVKYLAETGGCSACVCMVGGGRGSLRCRW